jgi:hypothetical protein
MWLTQFIKTLFKRRTRLQRYCEWLTKHTKEEIIEKIQDLGIENRAPVGMEYRSQMCPIALLGQRLFGIKQCGATGKYLVSVDGFLALPPHVVKLVGQFDDPIRPLLAANAKNGSWGLS